MARALLPAKPLGILPASGQECPLHTVRLFHLYDCTSLSELLLDGLGFFLGNTFLNVLRRSVDQFLGFFQAQAGHFADGLDHVDLVGANFLEKDGELRLLFRRSRACRPAAAADTPRRSSSFFTSCAASSSDKPTIESSNCCKSAMFVSPLF